LRRTVWPHSLRGHRRRRRFADRLLPPDEHGALPSRVCIASRSAQSASGPNRDPRAETEGLEHPAQPAGVGWARGRRLADRGAIQGRGQSNRLVYRTQVCRKQRRYRAAFLWRATMDAFTCVRRAPVVHRRSRFGRGLACCGPCLCWSCWPRWRGMGSGRRRLCACCCPSWAIFEASNARPLVPALAAAGVCGIAVLGDRNPAAEAGRKRFCASLGFPCRTCLVNAEPKLHRALGLYEACSSRAVPGRTCVDVGAGIGSPAPLAEVLACYTRRFAALPSAIADDDTIQAWPLPPIKGPPSLPKRRERVQRTFELATMRLRNMAEGGLGHWRTYVHGIDFLTQRGGTFLLGVRRHPALQASGTRGILGFFGHDGQAAQLPGCFPPG